MADDGLDDGLMEFALDAAKHGVTNPRIVEEAWAARKRTPAQIEVMKARGMGNPNVPAIDSGNLPTNEYTEWRGWPREILDSAEDVATGVARGVADFATSTAGEIGNMTWPGREGLDRSMAGIRQAGRGLGDVFSTKGPGAPSQSEADDLRTLGPESAAYNRSLGYSAPTFLAGAIGGPAAAALVSGAQGLEHGPTEMGASMLGMLGMGYLGKAPGRVGRAASDSVRGVAETDRPVGSVPPRTEAGRIIQNVEAGSTPTSKARMSPPFPIGEYGRPARGGIFDEQAIRDLPEGRAGVVKLAEQLAPKIVEHLEARHTANGEGLKAIEKRVIAKLGDPPLDPSGLIAGVDAEIQSGSMNGKPYEAGEAGVLKHARDMLHKEILGVNGEFIRDKDNRVLSVPNAQLSKLIEWKRWLGRRADFDLPATPETAPYRSLYHVARKYIDEVTAGTELPEANKAYGIEADKLAEANGIIQGVDAPVVAESTGRRKRAVQTLIRTGDNSMAGLVGDPFLKQLGAQHPMYADALMRLNAVASAERARFNAPHYVGATPHATTGWLVRNMPAAKARIIDPAARAAVGVQAPMTAAGVLSGLRDRETKEKLDALRRLNIIPGETP